MEVEGAERLKAELLRQIPGVDELLGRAALRQLAAALGHRVVVQAARKVLQSVRAGIAGGNSQAVSVEAIECEIIRAAEVSAKFTLEPVINATGVILHTNLGRAPLGRPALEHLAAVAGRYSNLEYDLGLGQRGRRDGHTDQLFAELIGAERTLVVNNNAAAVFLTLNALAEGGEVLVSRGELIEIGESFRIPDICAKSGAILKEVGTTNRTRLADYEREVNERTRAILRVHPSNFRLVGFTERPALAELAELAHRHARPLIEDLGSGCLNDLTPLGIQGEPSVGQSLKEGADVVTFSGDKLLGGPQAGLITGKRELLDRIRKNPLFRALRVDKLTIAALEATIRAYLDGNLSAIPAMRMITAAAEEVSARAEALAARLAPCTAFSVRLEQGESVIGGGATPGQSLPTRLLAVRHFRLSAQELESALRRHAPPVIARVEQDRVLLDLRTVFEDQEEELARALERTS